MTVAFHSRALIGLTAPDPRHLSLRSRKLRGVIVHWIGGPSSHPSITWRSLQANAMNGHNVNGTRYGDIEYNQGFCESVAHPGNGTLLAGRDNKYNGGHAKSDDAGHANTDCLGIALVGDQFTKGAEEALRLYLFLAHTLCDPHQPFVLEGHDELHGIGGISTACPGPALTAWVQKQRRDNGFVTL